jgi:MFS family permease
VQPDQQQPQPDHQQPDQQESPPDYQEAQQGYQQSKPGFPQAQPDHPQTQPGHPQAQPDHPQVQPGHPQPRPGYPLPQQGYPQPQQGYPQAQPGLPRPQPGYPQPQPGYQQPQPEYRQPHYGYPQPQQVYRQPQPGHSVPYSGHGYPATQSAPVFDHSLDRYQGSFRERLHSYGGSNLFLVGIILFSVGHLISLISTLGIFTVTALPTVVLILTGFWLIYAASKAPKLPEKTKTALVLFKVNTIIGLVISSLVTLIVFLASCVIIIASIALSQGYYASSESVALMIVGILFLPFSGILVVYIVIYYKALLKLLSGIQRGISSNVFVPLPGIKAFTVITYIAVGIAALGAFVMLGIAVSGPLYTYDMYYWMHDLPWESQQILGSFIGSFYGIASLALSSLSTLITQAGTVLCVIVLNRFNNSLKRESLYQQQIAVQR